jgi:DNA-binding HxlR family transcriptional regulator
MLTRTLRRLERDGLIARHDHQEVPPRVEYRLTDLGRGLLIGMMPLWGWVIGNAHKFHAARRDYDEAGN